MRTIFRNILSGSSSVLWAKRIIYFFLAIAFLHPFIANDVPLINYSEHGLSFPVINKILGQGNFDPKQSTWSLGTLIPYSAEQVDIANSNYKSPFAQQQTNGLYYRHWFGTDKLGRDTLAGLIHGTWIAVVVGFFSALFAVILGILLGLLAGYFGNDGLSWNILQMATTILTLIGLVYIVLVGLFFGSAYDGLLESLAGLLLILIAFIAIKGVHKLNLKKYSIPIDAIILRVLEIFKAVPSLFLILALLAIIKHPSIYHIILIISLVRWPISCRYTRAEVLSIKEEDFITSAHTLAITKWEIMLKHILPNAIGPAIISFAFGVSAAIVLEATLSFLGLGLSIDQVTWGSMLSEVRSYYKAWWLAVFPGFLLFIVVFSFNILGERANAVLRGTV